MSSVFLIDAHVSVYRDLRIAVNLGALVRILTNLNMKDGQNTDLNNQNVEFRRTLKSQKMANNEFTHENNEFSHGKD